MIASAFVSPTARAPDAASPEAFDAGAPRTLLGGDVDPTGAEAPPDGEAAVAEYPSASAPRPLGAPSPPRPALANAIQNHHFDDAWALGYRGAGVRVAVVDDGVDFGHPDLAGTQAVVTDPASPYLGWPIVYDPESLFTYLKTGYPDNTWYANTTGTGLGPFDFTHTIKVDGTRDFGNRELWGFDPRDNLASGAGGDKEDFDLTDLYVTRDDANWYVGFSTYLKAQNASFMLVVDVDNGTGGSSVLPRGTVDTNTTHADGVNDVAWSPDGTKLATASSDRTVRIWSRGGVLLYTLFGHSAAALSVAWSRDGTRLASADKDRVFLWDPATGARLWDVPFPTAAPADPARGVLAFSGNGTWLAAATNRYVHFFAVATGAKFGTLWASTFSVNGVAFHPSIGDRMAVATEDPAIKVYTLDMTNIRPGIPAVPATPLYTLTNHTQSVLDVAWSSDGNWLASGGRDNTVRVANAVTRTLAWTGAEAQSPVFSVAWSPSDSQVAAASEGVGLVEPGSLLMYDAAGAFQVKIPQRRSVYGVDWSSLDEVATAGGDLTARVWTAAGVPVRVMTAQRPDYAMYVHGFSRFSDRENKYVHGAELADWYRWDAPNATWTSSPLRLLGGDQDAFQFGDVLFTEFQIPRALLGDPAAAAFSVFSMHENGSRAQDSVPLDRSVDFKGLDFSPGWSSLSTFSWRRIERYTVSGLTTLSGRFHFGYHPGPAVQREYGALGVLVADGSVAGQYDRVYLDMNDDKVFDAADAVVSKANPIATIDTFDAGAGGPGQDGVPDISAGMAYFIADGVNPVPYSARLAARKAADLLQVRIPAAGDLVAFAGEFSVEAATSTPAEHGTRIASAIVAQARLPTPIEGTANAARLIAIMNGLYDPLDAWAFAVEGYDADPTTGDDQAHVVVSPFNFPAIHHDGWDVYSRTADYLSSHVSTGNATFVASAGDYGFGYGTVQSPASGPSVIAVGRAGDFSLLSSVVGGPEGPNPHFRDGAIPGSRGPSAAGYAKPELLAVDTTHLDIPLHAAGDGTTAVTSSPMTGSDVSAALVAGAAALVMEAFNAARGRMPKYDEVRAILMSAADDAGQDVLTQGAGFLNVSRAVRLAEGTADAGLVVSPSTWHPGTYRGAARSGFTNLVYPGEVHTDPFVLSNEGSLAISASVEAVAYAKIGEYVHTNATRTDPYQPTGNIALWVNDTGLWKVDGATLTAVRLLAPVPGLWAGAELVKVTAYSDLSRLTYKVSDTAYIVNYSYTLKAYDWTIDWANWFPGFGPFPAPSIFMNELNTVGETFHQSNALEVRAAFPAAALHEGLVISLESPDATLAVDNLPWTFTFEFYDRAPWPWTSPSPASLTVPPGASAAVDLTLTVPANAGVGSYEAAILVRDATHGLTTTVPVLVNVGARTPSLTFGGNLLSSDLYDANRLFGGYDRGLVGSNLRRPALGDWRFYFFEIPDQGIYVAPVGYKVLVRTAWIDAPSDVDIFAFGRTGADAASQGDGAWYGPFTLRQAGKTEEMIKPEFRTATAAGEEVLAYELASGLNVIALRGFQARGLEASVRLTSGQAGWISAPTSVDVSTRARQGMAPLAVLSNMDLPALRASAVGPAQTTAWSEVPVQQDVQSWWNFPAWGEWMSRSTFNYTFNVEKALILEVAIQGKSDVADLDLAVFRNAAGAPCEWDPAILDPLTEIPGYWKTCVVDPEEYLVVDPVVWNYDADGDADERVKWTLPADGQYIVKVLGYTVLANPGHFDFQISVTLDTGTGYQIYEAPKPAEIVNGTTPLPAFTRVPLNMTWDFPPATEDDRYGGAVLLGLPNASGVVVVPASVLLDRVAPVVTAFKLTALGGEIDRSTNRTTNDPSPYVVISVEDLDWGQLVAASVRVRLDGADVTSLATVGIFFTIRNNRAGLWDGTISFAPPPLPEGTHAVEAEIADRAGNVGTGSFTFAEDSAGPPLVLNGSPLQYTRAATHTVAGTTDPGASVNVRGAWYVADSLTGAFSVDVPLVNGTNSLAVTAADWFDVDPSGNPEAGNTAEATQTVIRDLEAPTFTSFAADPSGTTVKGQTTVRGVVADDYSVFEDGSTLDLVVRVDDGTTNATVPVFADGSFRVNVTLVEGANVVTATVVDLTGNLGFATLTVTRDTTAPSLDVTASPGTTVTTGTVTIAGTTEPGAFVLVNGFIVPSPGGVFSTGVALSPGENLIVVQALDAMGNKAEERVTVTYEAPGGVGLAWIVGVLAVGAVAGVLLALLFVRGRARVPSREEEGPEEAPPEEAAPVAAEPVEAASEPEEPVEEAAPEEMLEEPVEEAAPEEPSEGPPEVASLEEVSEEPAPEVVEEPVVEAAEVEDPRVARLRAALAEGRITPEVFEQNLQRIAPAAAVAAAPTPAVDPRIARLRKAYEEGRITKEVYQENLRRIRDGGGT